MGAPRTEIHNTAASGGFDNPRCFSDCEALKVDLVQYEGFHQLRLQNGRNHLNDWLVGENQSSFRQRINVPGESHLLQQPDKRLGELAAPSQVVQFLVIETEGRKKIENIVDPGRDNVIAVRRHLAKGQLKYSQLIHVLGCICLRHG